MKMRKIKVHGIYRHFKGKSHYVEDVAIDSETLSEMVIYRQLYGNRELFVRSMSMFLSEVDHDKYPQVTCKYRFSEVEDIHEVKD